MHMKSRYILFRRSGVCYAEDTVTRKQYSLRTKDESETMVLLNVRNESFRQPVLNLQIARAYGMNCWLRQTSTRATFPVRSKISWLVAASRCSDSKCCLAPLA